MLLQRMKKFKESIGDMEIRKRVPKLSGHQEI